jgi:hypothetical protein
MKKGTLHFFRNGLLLILALQIMNMSVNSIDFRPVASIDLQEFNDLNTFTEYFAEIVLGHINAFPESVQKEQKQSQMQKHVAFKLAGFTPLICTNNNTHLQNCYQSPANDNKTCLFCKEIIPPPPKV